MPIISKPVEILKGQDNIFTLDKATLAAETKVVNDAYFVDQDNWDRVTVAYITDVGGQVEFVTFDATQATPTGLFNVSIKGRDLWEVDSIIIKDFDGGYLRFERSELTTSEFDVNFNPTIYYTTNFATALETYEYPFNGNGTPIVIAGNKLSFDQESSGGHGQSVFRIRPRDMETAEGGPTASVAVHSIQMDFNVSALVLSGATLDVKIWASNDLASQNHNSGTPIAITSTGPVTITIDLDSAGNLTDGGLDKIYLNFTSAGGTLRPTFEIDSMTWTLI